jgi:hypothetical protein
MNLLTIASLLPWTLFFFVIYERYSANKAALELSESRHPGNPFNKFDAVPFESLFDFTYLLIGLAILLLVLAINYTFFNKVIIQHKGQNS